jgi:DNA polymerase-3 subunit epsilon
MIDLLTKPLVVVDIETTGTNPFCHDVLAIGLVPVAADRPATTVYIRQNHYVWSDYAGQLFGKYKSEWTAHAVQPSLACDAIEIYLKQTFGGNEVTPVGHNVAFDQVFIKKLAFLGGQERLAGLSHRAVDTHTLLYILYLQGRLPADALTSDGAFQYFGINVGDDSRHTALADAQATRELLLHLLDAFKIAVPSMGMSESGHT